MQTIVDSTSHVVHIIRRSSLQMSQKVKRVQVSDLNPVTWSGVILITLQNIAFLVTVIPKLRITYLLTYLLTSGPSERLVIHCLCCLKLSLFLLRYTTGCFSCPSMSCPERSCHVISVVRQCLVRLFQ